MYTVKIGEVEITCDDGGRPSYWGEEKAYYTGGVLTYIGNRKVYRDSEGNATHIGSDAVGRDSFGKVTSIGGIPVPGLLNLE